MKIDQQALNKIAHLSRLEIDPAKAPAYMQGMEDVLNWMQQLDELDTEGVEPLTNMSFELNAFREDIKGEPLDHERALQSAPKRDDDYFRVPKVIE